MKGNNYNLDSAEVFGIFMKAKKLEWLNSLPPVKPTGEIFIYNMGSETSKYDEK